jgi:tRNA threonylcarbamoyladenosine dehydratase
MDFERRFGGVRRLYGDDGLAKLQAAHVVVIGIGGVGSWAAEALVRNAVGTLTLIDLDNIAESNFNRQIHALANNIGKAKVTAMHERIKEINPLCKVHEIEDFITPENVNDALVANIHKGGDVVIIDATDDVKAKVAIAAFCKAQCITLIISGGAGGKIDATKIQAADLSVVQGDKLLAKVRNLLRRDFNFPKASNTKKSAKFGLMAVFSDEQVVKPEALCDAPSGDVSLTGLNCAGYGSSVNVTATFGFVCAQLALQSLLAR